MAAGEAWIFDNWRRHRVDNFSDDAHPPRRRHVGHRGVLAVRRRSASATSDRFIAFRPSSMHGSRPNKQRPCRDRRQPVEPFCTDFIGELVVAESVPEAEQNLPRFIGLLNGFLFDWRQVYLLHGENPDAHSQYASVLQNLREATQPIAHGLVMTTNQSPAQAVLESRLLQHVLRFDDAADSSPTRNVRHAVGPAPSQPMPKSPLIIVSAPRSGSTLLFETLAVSSQVCTVGGEAHWLVEQIPSLRPGRPGVHSNRLNADLVLPEVARQIGESLWARMLDAAASLRDPVDGPGFAVGRENAEELVANPGPWNGSFRTPGTCSYGATRVRTSAASWTPGAPAVG